MSPGNKRSREWQDYEKQIFEHLKGKAGSKSTVLFNQSKRGRLSGVDRQIDVWVEGSFAEDVEETVTAVVDCKHYTRNVNVKTVEAFMGLVEDVGADLGIIITSKGYSAAAKRRASVGRCKLHVVARVAVVAVDEWEEWNADDFVWHNDEESAAYQGQGFDFSPYGPTGCAVTYTGADKTGEVLNGADVDWSDDDGRREVIRAMMTHLLGRPPVAHAVEGFLEEYRDRMAAGFPFEFTAYEVDHMAS